VLVLIAGYSFYSRHQHTKRQDALAHAIQVEEAPVGPPTPGQNLNFPTEQARDQVALKAFSDIAVQYSGSAEGEIANYYIGSIKADQGSLAEAEKAFKEVADRGDDRYSSLAKLSLAQIYFADGRAAQGEALLRGLIAHPTVFVSTEEASIALARLLGPKNPAEARKLLGPLRAIPGQAGTTSMNLYNELPQ
jgi:predicted negative regulator of RcsB-dependent stress response